MKQTRRLRQGAGALLLALAAALAPAAQGQAQTVTAVMQSGLRVLDPVMTTAFMTRDHGYMIYDTLLGTDEHFSCAAADGQLDRVGGQEDLRLHAARRPEVA